MVKVCYIEIQDAPFGNISAEAREQRALGVLNGFRELLGHKKVRSYTAAADTNITRGDLCLVLEDPDIERYHAFMRDDPRRLKDRNPVVAAAKYLPNDSTERITSYEQMELLNTLMKGNGMVPL